MSTTIEGIKFYNIYETAHSLRVTPQTVRAYVKQGRMNVPPKRLHCPDRLRFKKKATLI